MKKNPFEIFNIPVSFYIESHTLTKRFIELQKEYHPDSHTHSPQVAMDISTAYHTIKDDIKRGNSILEIFQINQDSIKLPDGFFQEILNVTEQMFAKTKDFAENLIELQQQKLKNIGDITKENIEEFSIEFTYYKYIKRAFINSYGS